MIDIPASHGEAHSSCAYNSCRHASTQIRKKSSTEVMLTNATEDFEQLRRTLLKPMRRSMKLFPQERIQRTVEQRE